MKIKPVISALSLGVLIIFVVQNFSTTRLSFLVWELSLPRAVIFLLLFALGFVTGMLFRGLRR